MSRNLSNAPVFRPGPLSAALVLATSVGLAGAAAPLKAPPTQRNFIACPVVRDTPDVPCWIAKHKGETYFLTPQTGRSGGVVFAPQLKHKALIEGTVTNEPRICGGIVLKDVKVSVMEETLEPACNTILPAGGYTVKSPRPLGPDGTPPTGKPTNTSIRRPPQADRRAIAKAALDADIAARKPREYRIEYFFNTSYLPFPVEQNTVDEAADYAVAIKASKVEVIGYRGQTVLSDGRPFVERADIAKERADSVTGFLKNFGVPGAILKSTWNDAPQDNGGVSDYHQRRTTIVVTP